MTMKMMMKMRRMKMRKKKIVKNKILAIKVLPKRKELRNRKILGIHKTLRSLITMTTMTIV